MKVIRQHLVMVLSVNKWRNYKITEVAQVHMITFWITLALSLVTTLFYLVWSLY